MHPQGYMNGEIKTKIKYKYRFNSLFIDLLEQ